FNSYLNRWKEILKLPLGQNLPVSRALSCTKFTIDSFFVLLRQTYDKLKLHHKPSSIFNMDEKGFSCSRKNELIICERGTKFVHKLTGDGEKKYYTVVSCCNASGIYCQPLIIFKG